MRRCISEAPVLLLPEGMDVFVDYDHMHRAKVVANVLHQMEPYEKNNPFTI